MRNERLKKMKYLVVLLFTAFVADPVNATVLFDNFNKIFRDNGGPINITNFASVSFRGSQFGTILDEKTGSDAIGRSSASPYLRIDANSSLRVFRNPMRFFSASFNSVPEGLTARIVRQPGVNRDHEIISLSDLFDPAPSSYSQPNGFGGRLTLRGNIFSINFSGPAGETFAIDGVAVERVPLPASLALLSSGFVGLMGLKNYIRFWR